MKQKDREKKRGRERGEGKGGSLERLSCQPAPTCIPVAMAAVPNRTWGTTWLASLAGREEKGRERRKGRMDMQVWLVGMAILHMPCTHNHTLLKEMSTSASHKTQSVGFIARGQG